MNDLGLTGKQAEVLAQFKECVHDISKPRWDDYYLCRWLKAQSWDLKKAEKMLRDDADWRRKNDIDNLLNWTPPEVLEKYFPGGYCGVDKEGYPIWIDYYGAIDLKGMMYSTTKKEIIKYELWEMEKYWQEVCPELSKKYGKNIGECVSIFDMDGIGRKHLWKPAIQVMTDFFAIAEAHYPESTKMTYIINAPAIFPVAYAMVKPFIGESERNKIKVLSGDWKSYLLKHIDADQLPVHWGGTATGPDGNEFCSPEVGMGGKIPDKYRIDNFLDNVDMSQFVTASIKPGSSLQLDYTVTIADSIISWQFKSEGNDIGFGVYKRTADGRQKAGEMEEVLASERVNAHMVPESGQHICLEAGTYVLRFDNTYSWLKSKKLQYLVEVHAPDPDEEL